MYPRILYVIKQHTHVPSILRLEVYSAILFTY